MHGVHEIAGSSPASPTMNAYRLKILACVLMTIDHIGVVFFPTMALFRIIGRPVFLIFAYLLTEGIKHSKNHKKYLATIFLFALITEPVYKWLLHNQSHNIFFTLFAGMCSVLIYEKVKNKDVALLLVILISAVAQLLSLEYGFYGVLTIFIFSRFHLKSEYKKLFGFLLFNTAMLFTLTYLKFPTTFDRISIWYYIQFYSLVALPILLNYDGKRGPSHKYAFYIFYPLHLAILGIIKYYII